MDLLLASKHVVVTGASKGIGLAIARQFAAEGCSVSMIARNAEALTAAAESIRRNASGDVRVIACDVGAAGASEAILAAADDADILVNNAGDIPGGTIDDVDEVAWRAAWDGKVFGYINLSRAFLSGMRARRSGAIVNVIGIAGDLLDPTYIAGATGNAALIAFTRSLGAWTPQFGVRVVGLSPGPVATDRLVKIQKRKALAAYGDEARYVEAESRFPFGRAASAEEVAHAVAFLASPLSAYTSGVVLNLDGGISGGRIVP